MFHKSAFSYQSSVISSRLSADSRQRGFSIVSAIFLMVTLAALGAFLVSVSGTQHITAGQDVQGARAYQAARAGVEWGAYQALRNAAYACTTAGSSSDTPAFGGSLAGFTVTVACALTTTTEGGNAVNVYTITSTATAGTVNTKDYVQRQLRVVVGR